MTRKEKENMLELHGEVVNNYYYCVKQHKQAKANGNDEEEQFWYNQRREAFAKRMLMLDVLERLAISEDEFTDI